MQKFLIRVIIVLTVVLLAGCILILFGINGPAQPTEPTGTTPPTTTTPEILTGWVEEGGKRYYLDEKGNKCTGWLELEDGDYYLGTDGAAVTGWNDVDGANRYFGETGALYSGWLERDGKTYYLTMEGTLTSGWIDVGAERYYLTEDGSRHTGWLELDGDKYYFREDGTMGRGRVFVTDLEPHYFLENGKEILLVNPWNAIPDDYEVELITYSGRHKVAVECYDALKQMLADCKTAGYTAIVCSAYRTHEYQKGLYEKQVQKQMANGLSREEAEIVAATISAFPGTSEHQLGLAVDLVDVNYQLLNEQQENTAAQKWLMANSWRYGFNLRYPNGKTEQTGIIYEPWHYRYVGVELAKELYESGLCLEEYLEALTK